MNTNLLLVFLWNFWTKGWSLFDKYKWCIAFFFLPMMCVSVSFSAGPVPQRECVLSPVNNSHPVHALLESFTVLSGCASRGTTSLPQEVHILNLRNPKEGLGHHEREVKGKLLFLQIPGDKCLQMGLLYINLLHNVISELPPKYHKEPCAICMEIVHLCFACYMNKLLPYLATIFIIFHNHKVYLKKVGGGQRK